MSNRQGIRKPDVFTNPSKVGDVDEEALYHALGPLDRVASEMERKWGVERLPTLVSPETASKFGSAKGKLDLALDMRIVSEVSHRAGVLIRGWYALDAEATAAGHEPMSADAWTWMSADGVPHAICFDRAARNHVTDAYQASGEKLRAYSLEEIARIVKWFDERSIASEVKEAFPGGEITGIGKASVPAADFDDALPI
jgi:hypothetical protein